MDAQDFVLVQGLSHTRETFGRWNRDPWPVLGRWMRGSLVVAFGLLGAVWVVAHFARVCWVSEGIYDLAVRDPNRWP